MQGVKLSQVPRINKLNISSLNINSIPGVKIPAPGYGAGGQVKS